MHLLERKDLRYRLIGIVPESTDLSRLDDFRVVGELSDKVPLNAFKYGGNWQPTICVHREQYGGGAQHLDLCGALQYVDGKLIKRIRSSLSSLKGTAIDIEDLLGGGVVGKVLGFERVSGDIYLVKNTVWGEGFYRQDSLPNYDFFLLGSQDTFEVQKSTTATGRERNQIMVKPFGKIDPKQIGIGFLSPCSITKVGRLENVSRLTLGGHLVPMSEQYLEQQGALIRPQAALH